MTTSETIAAVLAILTFLGIVVAMTMSVLSLRETRRAQKALLRDQLLTSIEEWVTSSVQIGYSQADTPSLHKAGADFDEQRKDKMTIIGRWWGEASDLVNRGIYIASINDVFGQELSDAVRDASKAIFEWRDALKDYLEDLNAATCSAEFQTAKNHHEKLLDEKMDMLGKFIPIALRIIGDTRKKRLSL